MICPNCKKDYRDVNEGTIPGHFYRGDDHFNREERRYGMQCTNCGFIAEVVARVTGNPYRKKDYLKDNDTLDMFDQEELDIGEFQQLVGKWGEKNLGLGSSQKIIHKVKDNLMDLVMHPSSENEWAKIFLLLLYSAHINSFDLLNAAKKQFEEVKNNNKELKHVTRKSNTRIPADGQ